MCCFWSTSARDEQLPHQSLRNSRESHLVKFHVCSLPTELLACFLIYLLILIFSHLKTSETSHP